MGDQHNGEIALVLNPTKDIQYLPLHHYIKTCCRLVRQKKRRIE